MKPTLAAGTAPSRQNDLMQAHAAEASFPIWKLFTALALIVMQLAWLVPWYQLLTRLSAPVPFRDGYLLFGALMLAAFVANLAAILLKLKESVRRVLLLGLVVAGAWIGMKLLIFRYIPMTFENVFNRTLEIVPDISALIRPEILVVVFVLIAWQRGMMLAQEQLGPQAVMRHFRVGVFALLLYALIASRLVASPTFSLGLFLLSGLLSMAGARFTFLGQIRGGRKVAFRPLWMLGLLAVALALLAASAFFGGLAEGVFASWVAGALEKLWAWMSAALLTLVGPVVVIIARAWVRVLAWFRQFNSGGGEMDESLFNESFNAGMEDLEELAQPPAWLDQAGAAAQAVVAFVALAMVAVIAVYALRRYRSRREAWAEEERESLLSGGELRAMLRGMFRRRAVTTSNTATRLSARQQRRAAARIRQLYAALLRLGDSLDVSRPPALTPNEYLPHLTQVLPGSVESLEEITAAYLAIRYGELPESADDVRRVEAAWQAVENEGRMVQREQRSLRRRVRSDDDDWRGV